MEDRGEKIVNLAREMLRSEIIADQPPVNFCVPATNPAKAKTLLIVALLAALGGSALTHLIDEMRRPVNHYEKVELDALLFYAARTNNVDEAQIRRDVIHHTGITRFDCISATDYRQARDYLRNRIP